MIEHLFTRNLAGGQGVDTAAPAVASGGTATGAGAETVAAGAGAGVEAGVLSPARLLAAAKRRRVDADRAEAELLAIACDWADAHPPESIHDAATFVVRGFEHEEQIAGEGCPLVAEFCIAELGSALGLSTVSGKHLVGQALELRHRLRRCWRLVHTGRLPAWRARRIAEATIHAYPPLPPDAARWVDAQIAPFAATCSVAQIDRLIAEAIKRFQLVGDPEDPRSPDDPDPDGPLRDRRHVTMHDHVGYDATIDVTATLDLADAQDLDTALAHGAATLKALGSTETLGGRRAAALGDLARRQTALDLHTQTGSPVSPQVGDDLGRRLPKARQVVLHVHAHAAFTGAGLAPDGLAAMALTSLDGAAAPGGVATGGIGLVRDPLARLEEGQRLVLLDQVKAWCRDTHTTVSIRPVIDTGEIITAPGYQIPDRLREQVVLRDQSCVFPHCTRPARRCQLDHVIPFNHDAEGGEQPGPTSSDNLACLCAFHHRLKTHGRWRYTMVSLGVVEWTSPRGHRFRRDRHGTTPLDEDVDRLDDPDDVHRRP